MIFKSKFSDEDYPDPGPVGYCAVCGEPIEADDLYYKTGDEVVHAGGNRGAAILSGKTRKISCLSEFLLGYGDETLAEAMGMERGDYGS
jgi:hypothetical protein